MNNIIPRLLNYPFLLVVLFAVIFLLLPNNNPGYDSYSYSIDVREGKDLFHPHHLLYNLAGFLFYRIFMFTGLGSMKILSLVNTLLGISSLILVYRIISNRADRFMAVIGALISGFLFSFWYYSTSVEVNMPAIMFLLLSLYYLIVKHRSIFNSVLIYLFLAVGILFHQLVALYVLPILIYDYNRTKSISNTVKYSLPGLLTCFVVYLIIAVIEAPDKSLGGLYQWLTFYSHLDAWGNLDVSNFTLSLWGLLKTFFGGDIIRHMFYGENQLLNITFYLTIITVFFCCLFGLFINSLIRLVKNVNPFGYLLLAMISISSLFAFWWAPADDGFWLYPVLIFIIFVFRNNFSLTHSSKIIKTAASTALLLIALFNIIYEFIPLNNRHNSVFQRGAESFNRLNLTSKDFVLTNFSQIRLAYHYHYNTHVPTASVMYLKNGNTNEIISNYRKNINEAIKNGRVIIFENEIFPEPYRYYLFNHFSAEDYLKIYKPYLDYLLVVDSLMIYGNKVKLYEITTE